MPGSSLENLITVFVIMMVRWLLVWKPQYICRNWKASKTQYQLSYFQNIPKVSRRILLSNHQFYIIIAMSIWSPLVKLQYRCIYSLFDIQITESVISIIWIIITTNIIIMIDVRCPWSIRRRASRPPLQLTVNACWV